MSKITEFPTLTGTEANDQDYLYLVDVSDTTENAAGSSKKISVQDLANYRVPTAAYLSQGDNLQSYIDSELARSNRRGPIVLPQGRITITSTLNLNRLNGVRIVGQGQPSVDVSVTNTIWDDSDVDESTMIYFNGSADDPVISMEGISYSILEGFGIDRVTKGVGIRYTDQGPANCSFNSHKHISIFRCTKCIECVDTDDHILQADMTFEHVTMSKSDIGLQTNGHQQVNFAFYGLCYWISTNTAIEVNDGGNIYIHGCATNGVTTFIRFTGDSAANSAPCVISGLKIDRTGFSTVTTIVDCSAEDAKCAISIDGLGVTKNASDVFNDNYRFFKINSNYAPYNSFIQVNSTNLRMFASGRNAERVYVYNNSGTELGYIGDGTYNAI